MKNANFRALVTRGALYGNISAFVASALFTCLESVIIAINGWRLGITDTFKFDFSLLTFGFGCFLAFLPATLGGGLLAWKLNQDHSKNRLSFRSAFTNGAFLGGLAGFSMCFFVIFLVLMFILFFGKGTFWIFIVRSIEVIILAALAGGFTGQNIAQIIFKQKSKQRDSALE